MLIAAIIKIMILVIVILIVKTTRIFILIVIILIVMILVVVVMIVMIRTVTITNSLVSAQSGSLESTVDTSLHADVCYAPAPASVSPVFVGMMAFAAFL